ncbi:hypothetical protein [Amycolatopsis anabasis]|uniref:hypothetical protein n=1 Tax=Amycolatopsis anabasis TaxID=1840409 RepID=UPI00131E2939|nr:hypothetical protein [Amycolatopsis anabasis]
MNNAAMRLGAKAAVVMALGAAGLAATAPVASADIVPGPPCKSPSNGNYRAAPGLEFHKQDASYVLDKAGWTISVDNGAPIGEHSKVHLRANHDKVKYDWPDIKRGAHVEKLNGDVVPAGSEVWYTFEFDAPGVLPCTTHITLPS